MSIWYCKKCKNNVDIIIGYEQGCFCKECGNKVIIDNKFFTGNLFNEIDLFFIEDDHARSIEIIIKRNKQ